MRRLKLHHLFGGLDIYVITGSVIVSMLALFLSMDKPAPVIILSAIAGALLPGIIIHLLQTLLLHCLPSVRRKLKQAAEPMWRELTPHEYDELKALKVRNSPALKGFLIAQIPIFVMGTLSEGLSHPLIYLILEAVAVFIALTHFITTWLIKGKWENIDGSARIAEVPIDHSYRFYIFSRSERFYVYYLPEGRFIVDEDQLYSAGTVKIVRWNGAYTYLHK